MNHISTRFFAQCAMAALMLLVASLFVGNQLAAQTNNPAIESGQQTGYSASGFKWRGQVAMEQIVQQELSETNASLALPNLTDWTTAMLGAYKSFLLYAQTDMQGGKDMNVVLDKAYAWIKTEPVQDKAMRNMVLDDMKAKQIELEMKLTFN